MSFIKSLKKFLYNGSSSDDKDSDELTSEELTSSEIDDAEEENLSDCED